MRWCTRKADANRVAPPRGERGLKYLPDHDLKIPGEVAPPRGERGLKSPTAEERLRADMVAPPRGERGLKSLSVSRGKALALSLPLVGSVD